MTTGRLLLALGTAAAFLLLPVQTAVSASAGPAATSADGPVAGAAQALARRPAVVERRVIGRSVRGRPIVAWRVGDPDARHTAVAISTMHGDERATRRILEALRDGDRIRGIDLWLVPTYNPDGLARHSRTNARGIDLNRNFPYRWRDLDGRYESGPRPASEPETRAMMRFLRDVRPRWVVSFHQPLHGVDNTKWPAFANRLSRELGLPRSRFTCGGACHGTMTSWFNHHFHGAAVTVEYGAAPSRHRLVHEAPGQLLRVFFARHVVPRVKNLPSTRSWSPWQVRGEPVPPAGEPAPGLPPE